MRRIGVPTCEEVLDVEPTRCCGAADRGAKAVTLEADDDRALEMAAYCHLQARRLAAALDQLQRARALVSDPSRASGLDELIAAVRARIAAGESADAEK